MKKIIAFLATAALSLQITAGAMMPLAASTEGLPPLVKVDTALAATSVEGNLLTTGGINEEANIADWGKTPYTLDYAWKDDGNGGGYIESGIFPSETVGLCYTPGETIEAGKYKVTFYVRTAYEGHLSKMRLVVVDQNGGYGYVTSKDFESGTTTNMNVYYGDEWTKAEFYFTVDAAVNYLKFQPAASPILYAPFCIDEISLEKVADADFPGNEATHTVGTAYINSKMTNSQANLALYNENEGKELWDIEEAEQYEVDGLMLNLDNTTHGIGAITCEQDIIDWTNQFRGTHVTDMIMNIAESKCVYPTDVFFGWYGEKTIKDETTGEYTDVVNTESDYYKHFTAPDADNPDNLGLDYLKTLTTALPEAGINMWMSVRMNDAHDRNLESSSLFTKYYFDHPEYRRVQYVSLVDNESYANIWNYAIDDIRETYLALLNESLDRYDVYGYQFEFQREIRLFHPGGEYDGIDIMNQFMRDAAEIIDIYEEKYGHKIKLSVQVAPDLQTNYDFGLDVMAWVGEGLVDMVSPKGRRTTYNEMPVALWESMLEPFDVELAPDIEHSVNGNSYVTTDMSVHNIETYAGSAALYYSQGADKIQLYNLLVPMGHIFKEQDKIAEFDPNIEIPEVAGSKTSIGAWWLVLANIGSYEKLMTMNRSVLLTANDVAAHWRGGHWQLPATLTDGATRAFRVGMGDIPAGATVTLKFAATDADASTAPVVYVNSELCTFTGVEETPSYNARTENKMYCYTIPASAHGDMYAVAEITPASDADLVIDYMEVYIEPAN